MRFGDTIRKLRQECNLSQRELAAMIGVTYTYVSKIENHKLDYGEHPSEQTICKLAVALDADEDTLLILAEKVPPKIKQRVMERPEAFRRICELDDRTLDRMLSKIKE